MTETSIEFDGVSFEYMKVTNVSSGIKEDLLRFVTNFGHDVYRHETYEVLRGIDFKLNHGDRMCIIGKNGAGKSTLLRLITGIYKPTSGNITTRGKISPLIEIGAGMDPELTGRENIYVVSLINGYTMGVIKNMEEAIIEFADIGDYIDVPVKYYSTGMGGRLAFSIATSVDPEILIVDELFAGGDINFIEKAERRIEEITNDASIFVAVSHNMDHVIQYFNKVLYIADNSVKYFGSDLNYAVQDYIKDNSI